MRKIKYRWNKAKDLRRFGREYAPPTGAGFVFFIGCLNYATCLLAYCLLARFFSLTYSAIDSPARAPSPTAAELVRGSGTVAGGENSRHVCRAVFVHNYRAAVGHYPELCSKIPACRDARGYKQPVYGRAGPVFEYDAGNFIFARDIINLSFVKEYPTELRVQTRLRAVCIYRRNFAGCSSSLASLSANFPRRAPDDLSAVKAVAHRATRDRPRIFKILTGGRLRGLPVASRAQYRHSFVRCRKRQESSVRFRRMSITCIQKSPRDLSTCFCESSESFAPRPYPGTRNSCQFSRLFKRARPLAIISVSNPYGVKRRGEPTGLPNNYTITHVYHSYAAEQNIYV